MKLKILYSKLPSARNWEDGRKYVLPVRQVSHTKDGVVLEIATGKKKINRYPRT